MRLLAFALVLAFIAGACASAPAAKSPPGATAVAPTAGAATPTLARSAPSTAAQAFLGITLTDVRTGERFTLGGSAGKVVIVEGMAVW
ncbi:MAG TPA: hypothetical protein VGK15_00110 [Candidatus Limnocylindria bacterium]|jgi:hypothetical protein